MDALEAANDLASNSVLLGEVSELITDMQAVVDVLTGTAQSFLINFADDTIDIFNVFEHPIQDRTEKDEWWWFDTLHYARTGTFAQSLLSTSATNTIQRAYALGYLTHVAGDVVGHPYVNAVVGGPFRTHAQRHKVLETFQDTWAWENYVGTELTRSALHNEFLLSGTDARMPSALSRFIVNNLEAVYGTSFSPIPSTKDIESAYRLWYEWFRSSTETGLPPDPWTYSLNAELQEAWDQFIANAGSILDGYKDAVNSVGGSFSLFGLLAALVGAIIAGLLLAGALLDFLAGALATLGAAPARAFLAITYQTLFSVYKQIRFVTSLKGLAMPLREDLLRPEIVHAVDSSLADIIGNTANPFAYPKREAELPPGLSLEDHLIHPVFSPQENPLATAGPDTYYAAAPSHYISGSVGFDLGWLTNLESGISVAQAQTPVFRQDSRTERLGNASRLSMAMHTALRRGRSLPNLSLDGDRGFSWPCNDVTDPISNPVVVTDL